MAKWKLGAVALLGLATVGCGGAKIVTVTFPKKDGNSEYWVCDRDAQKCHGRGEGDVDPTLYKPGLDTLSPPVECDHGAAKIEIVIKGNEVQQIGYECAQPPVTTGLPSSAASDDGAEDTPPPVDAPTGLPPVPEEESSEEESAPSPSAEGDASANEAPAATAPEGE